MKKSQQQGYMTLISVLTISAVGVAITLTLLILGTSASQSSFAGEQEAQARALAHGCVELALETIKTSSSYTGTTVVSPFGEGSCQYVVTDTGGNARDIDATATVDDITQRVKATLTNVSPIVVSSWLDVASF
jgi:hypothetical protein